MHMQQQGAIETFTGGQSAYTYEVAVFYCAQMITEGYEAGEQRGYTYAVVVFVMRK
jgi:hypothetical protein